MQRAEYASPLGELLLAADGGALVGLWFRGQKYEGAGLTGHEPETDETALLSSVRRWLDAYFSGERPETDFPVAPAGSAFRRRVWRELMAVPYGETLPYGELARRVGCASSRAVGGAVGHNPVALIIPCHRIVGSGGALTGYAGGLWRKEALLTMEQNCIY